MIADLAVANVGEQDDYQRVQRARARRVAGLLEKHDTVSRLTTASVMIAPVERLMFLWLKAELELHVVCCVLQLQVACQFTQWHTPLIV